jgi:hypothetical protein
VIRGFVVSAALLLSMAYSGPARAGSLTSTFSQVQVSGADLTAQGNLDWAVWGEGEVQGGGPTTNGNFLLPTDSMSGGSGIGSLTNLLDPSCFFCNGLGGAGNYGESTFNWSNGAPNATGTNVFSGVQQAFGTGATGAGFSLSVNAGTGLEELILYDTVNDANAILTASLSDSSAPVLVENLNALGGFNSSFRSIIDFSADSPGQILTVSIATSAVDLSFGSSNVAIQGAALSSPALSSSAPEPSTFLLSGAGIAFALFGLKRRKR